MAQSTDVRETDVEFSELAERHRRELHVHCYRMLAPSTRRRTPYRRRCCGPGGRGTASRATRTSGPGSTRSPPTSAWTPSGPGPGGSPSSARTPRWAGCSPTRTGCSTRSLPAEDEPDAVVVRRETIELAFLAALQVLPPRQRAVLVLRDVLGLPAAEAAAMLDPAWPRPTARCSGPGPRCRSTCPRTGWTGRHPRRSGRAGAAGPLRGRARAVRRRRRAGRRGRGHPGDHAAGAVLLRRAGRAGHPAGAGLRPGPGGRLAAAADQRQPDAGRGQLPAAGPATTRSARTSWTCCGSRTAPSRRSPPSGTRFPHVRPAGRAGMTRAPAAVPSDSSSGRGTAHGRTRSRGSCTSCRPGEQLDCPETPWADALADTRGRLCRAAGAGRGPAAPLSRSHLQPASASTPAVVTAAGPDPGRGDPHPAPLEPKEKSHESASPSSTPIPPRSTAGWPAGFTARVEGADRPRGVGPALPPVAGWAARDVVRHLVEWFPGFLHSRRRDRSSRRAVGRRRPGRRLARRSGDADPGAARRPGDRRTGCSQTRTSASVPLRSQAVVAVLHRRRLHAHPAPGPGHRAGRDAGR